MTMFFSSICFIANFIVAVVVVFVVVVVGIIVVLVVVVDFLNFFFDNQLDS